MFRRAAFGEASYRNRLTWFALSFFGALLIDATVMSAPASAESAWTACVRMLRSVAVTAEMASALLTPLIEGAAEVAAREREVAEAAGRRRSRGRRGRGERRRRRRRRSAHLEPPDPH